MRLISAVLSRTILFPLLITLLCVASFGQTAPMNRVVQAIDSTNVTSLRGNVSPLAKPAFDHGAVAPSFMLDRVTLVFQPTAAQQASLNALLQQQQDPASPNYHKWITPEQYADRFGLSVSDFNKVESWLRSQGFTIDEAARSRTFIAFNGTAGQIASAFRTQIHQYMVGGKLHYANATNPSIPAALAGIVQSFRSLNNFLPKPRNIVIRKVNPNFTSNVSGSHFLAPGDVATIYNITGLYNSGIDGTGQKIAVVGQTDITMSDIETFRSVSGLPVNDPTVTLITTKDPGIVTGDIDEANLDLEWSGAVAPKAQIIYINSANGAFDSMYYAIDNNIAPVVSVSYGDCEANFQPTDIASLTTLFNLAQAQGQTVVSASGDSGAADCDYSTNANTQTTTATHGYAVDIPPAFPNVTGIGGTEFNEGTGTYWNPTDPNNPNGPTAISYIPEMVWNDTTNDIASGGSLSASGGGKSTLFTKPSWQTGTGVPADGQRDVPDISFAASADHDGYLVCSQGSCVVGYRASAGGNLDVAGGTSAGAPVFAGIVALINQKAGSPQGFINQTLYTLAASTPGAFHDVTTGNNDVPCTAGTTDCPSGGSGEIGYDATVGYDLATGLGSIDATALATAWPASSTPPPAEDFTLATSASSLTMTRNSSSSVSSTATITVTGTNGFSGNVALTCSVSSGLTGVTCSFDKTSVAAGGTATLSVTAPTVSSTQSAAAIPLHLPLGLQSVFALSLGALFTVRKRKSGSRKLHGFLLVLMVACLLAGMVACGGGGSSTPAPPPAPTPLTGTVTVTGTSGTLTHSVSVSVTAN